MASVKLQTGRILSDYGKPYFVAELNSSHFGDLDIAKTMIETAKDVGCDCVKFQSWNSASLYSDAYYKENRIAKRMFDKFSMGQEQLFELSKYAQEVGIDFSSTPYTHEEAEFLATKCQVPFIKIASMELDNLTYLKFLGELQVPLVLSTGMGSLEEIMRAVEVVTSTGNSQLVVLHCTSIYPAKPDIIQLNNIVGLRQELTDIPIGFSDHSIGSEIPSASVALGACLIEKHFTLDSTRIGMDNQMATEPEGFQRMVESCLNVYHAMGSQTRQLLEEEVNQRLNMRRSIVAKHDLNKGAKLTIGDLDFKRPGTGISVADIDNVLGQIVTENVSAGTQICFDNLSGKNG